MTKIINAYDAYALLSKSRLHKGQLRHVLVDVLDVKKVMCISDSTDLRETDPRLTKSVAYTIKAANLGGHIEITQSDFTEFRPLKKDEDKNIKAPGFATHLPQQEHETRREYLKIDSTQLMNDLPKEKYDVILGRNCICACSGNGNLCGGIDISIKSQQQYLKALTTPQPSLIVMTANRKFFPESTAQRKAQLLYKEAKNNMYEACRRLNATENGVYRYKVIEMDSNLKDIDPCPQEENGYMVVVYDAIKVNFQPTTHSLQDERMKQKIEASQMAARIMKAELVDLKKQDSETEDLSLSATK